MECHKEEKEFSKKYTYDEVDKLINEIVDLQTLLKQEALKIMNNDSKKS